jgi:hypothetical protein
MNPKNQSQVPEAKPDQKLTYRTPDRFRRETFRRNPALNTKVRSFGGHR